MRPLAEFIMRGRMQAALVAGVAAAIPMMFWLSAAAAGLVLMRRGLAQSAQVILCALVPALVWAYLGDPFALLVIAGTLVMAQVLRDTSAWMKVLLASIVLGFFSAMALQSLFAGPIAEYVAVITEAMPHLLGDMYQQFTAEQLLQLESLLAPVLTGIIAATVQFTSLLSLMLARYWQSGLYNPGGFAQEFHSIRLSRMTSVVLVACMLLAPSLSSGMASLSLLCAVVLAVAGLALIHGLVGKYQLNSFWLYGFYLLLVFFVQLLFPMLVMIALVDSLFDFRGLQVSKKDTE